MGWQTYERQMQGAAEGTQEFGWRHVAANGRINAIGGEGFSRERDAERAIYDFLTEIGCDPGRAAVERVR